LACTPPLCREDHTELAATNQISAAQVRHVRAARIVPERATALEVAGAADRLVADALVGVPDRRIEDARNDVEVTLLGCPVEDRRLLLRRFWRVAATASSRVKMCES
jgi:hypothetical protein